MSASSAIEVRGLVYEYPGHRALDDVSFTIEPGSVTALVGPNGAGKTTLLSCIAALLTPMAGTVRVDGVDVLEHPRETHRHIGYLPDFYGLYDELSVQRTLWHAARVQGISTSDCAGVVDHVAGVLDLNDLRNAKAAELSRGQRQRLAIARTLVHRPGLLLLDEPASGLDPEARHSLAGLMRRLQGEGITLLVSSHILAELGEYSNEMMIIRNGRILEQRRISAMDAEATQFRLELCEPTSDVPQAVRAHPAVEAPRMEGDSVIFGFTGDARARHELLANLIAAGVAVSGLSRHATGLQDEYLRAVGHAGVQAPDLPS